MTIRLLDIEAQLDYQKDMESYEKRFKAQMDKAPGSPWPMDLVPPKYPDPMLDSRDQGTIPKPHQTPGIAAIGYVGSYPNGRDPKNQDQLDWDGTSQSAVKGYDSRASFEGDGNKAPFKGLTKR